MSKKEQNILHQLGNARESIRRKYNILKRNKEFIEKAVGETFKPLVNPLIMKPNNIEREKNNISLESDDIDSDAMQFDSVGEASDATLKHPKLLRKPIQLYSNILRW